MNLIREANNKTNAVQAKDDLYISNCDDAATSVGCNIIELNESAMDWLRNVQQEAKSGALFKASADNTAADADQISKLKDTAEIMGGIAALSDETNAEAMNVKNPRLILKVASSNHQDSDRVIDFLKGKGRSDARGQAAKAMEILKSGNPENVIQVLDGMIKKANKLVLGVDPAGTGDKARMGESAPGILGLSAEMKKTPQI